MLSRTVSILLLLSLGLVTSIALGNRVLNEDIFMAFCSGRDTLAGHLLSPNQWSFTMPKEVWVDQAWLSHLKYYVSFLLAGSFGPALIKTVLLSGSLAVVYFRCRSLGVSAQVSLIALMLGTLGLAPLMSMRAENFAMLYFVVMSSILTSPAEWGRWRQVCCVLILAIWCNSHGSFMLGFFLIALRFILAILFQLKTTRPADHSFDKTAKTTVPDGVSGPDAAAPFSRALTTERLRPAGVLSWLVTLLVSVAVMALANPFGPENLFKPIRHLLSALPVPPSFQWVDWMPLLDIPSIVETRFFAPLSVLPFLALVSVVCVLGILWLIGFGFRSAVSEVVRRPPQPEFLMVVLIPIIMVPLFLKFRRMIIFAAPAFVPLLAILIEQWVQALYDRYPKVKEFSGRPMARIAGWAAAVAVLVATGALFHRAVLKPNSAGNPLSFTAEERPLVLRLTGYPQEWDSAAQFLKNNDIRGKVFANEALSNYLLLRVPGIQVFYDLRSVGVYPVEIINAYASITAAGRESLDRGTRLLDDYGVDLVVLDTRWELISSLAVGLLETKKWCCIYRDRWVLILARDDSDRFASAIKSGVLDKLWYPRPNIRIVSEAILDQFYQGSIPPELLAKLKAFVNDDPDPNVYGLIVFAMNGRGPCLNREVKAFLEHEAARLSRRNYMVTGGAHSVLLSLLKVLRFLETDESFCKAGINHTPYSQLRVKYTNDLRDIQRQYGGL